MQTSKRIIKGFKNLDKVYEGINNFKNPKELVEQVALERSKQCLNCEHYKDETIDSLKVIDRIPELTNKMCNLCGCVLAFKLRTKIIDTDKCPLKND